MVEFWLRTSGKKYKEYVLDRDRWRPRKVGHFLTRLWNERRNCWRFGCESCAHRGKCPLGPLLFHDLEAKARLATEIWTQSPEEAAAIFASLVPLVMGRVLRPQSQKYSVARFGETELPDSKAPERFIGLISFLKDLAEALAWKDGLPQEISIPLSWGSVIMFWTFCRAAWKSADVMPGLRIQREKLEMGWYVKAPNELVAASCEALLMILHDIRRFNVCERCGAFFWLEHVKPRRRIERICPECREESKTRRREYDRRRKRSITPEARFFNTLSQAKKRGNISQEEAEALKRLCQEEGLDAARKEYVRLKAVRRGVDSKNDNPGEQADKKISGSFSLMQP